MVLESFIKCQHFQYVKSGLSQMIINFDPTIREDPVNAVPLDLINSYLDGLYISEDNTPEFVDH